MPIKRTIIFNQNKISRDLILCAADSFYFKKFHVKLIDSFSLVDSGQSLHFHIINPDAAAINLVEKLSQSEKLSFSLEYVDLNSYPYFKFDRLNQLPLKILKMLANEKFRGNFLARYISLILDKTPINPLFFLSEKFIISLWPKIYYSVSRFLLINQSYFDDFKSILIIDIDSIFKSKLDFINFKNDGIYIKKRSGTWSNHLAGCVYIKNPHKSKSFFKEFANLFEHYCKKGCFFWGIDQFLIDELASMYEIYDIPNDLFSVNPSISASIISFKGDAKWSHF